MKRQTLAAALACLAPAAAFGHEVHLSVEQGHAWALRAVESDGEVVADASFELYSPADPKTPFLKGRTDRNGYLAFVPNAVGTWRVKVVEEDGHGLDTTVQVANLSAPAVAPLAAASDPGFVLRPVLGGAAVLVVFGGLFWAYRRKAAKP